ncbi:MAG: C25 family cysteine peptidase [Fibrobacter sp.]|nr:C25 family cysteine peptidase [Fibrobacter sp.]
MIRIMCCILCVLCANIWASVVLEKIMDKSIVCDYLIICPEEMSDAAVNLAEHRNAFAGDDVSNAHVAHLENIIVEFLETDLKKRDKALSKAVNWAAQNWTEPLKYLVLIGDDEAALDTVDSTYYSIGKMPTWYTENNIFKKLDVSDDYYGLISNDTVFSTLYDFMYNIRIGRIPASTLLLANNYVEKVKRYDLYNGNRSWKNKVLAIADDKYQGELIDFVKHQMSSDIITDLCKGFFVKKLYTSVFPTVNLNSKPDAKDAIIGKINEGAGITVYYGHGHPSKLSDEDILNYSDADRLENDSMPTAFFSFSCENGNFMSVEDVPMCKPFLLKEQGGCIAYFAIREKGYASLNENLGKCIFKRIEKNPDYSLGQIVLESKIESRSDKNSTYYLLGDPALRCFSKTIPLDCTLLPDTISPSAFRINLPVNSLSADKNNYYVEFSFVDSVVPFEQDDMKFGRDSVFKSVSGEFQNTVDINIPSANKYPLKVVVFVWNGLGDGRAEFLIGSENAHVIFASSKKAKNVVNITVHNNYLSIINNRESGNKSGMLKIFNLQGQHLKSLNLDCNEKVINLKNHIKSSGRYIFLYCAGEVQVRKTFMILK